MIVTHRLCYDHDHTRCGRPASKLSDYDYRLRVLSKLDLDRVRRNPRTAVTIWRDNYSAAVKGLGGSRTYRDLHSVGVRDILRWRASAFVCQTDNNFDKTQCTHSSASTALRELLVPRFPSTALLTQYISWYASIQDRYHRSILTYFTFTLSVPKRHR